MIRQVRMFAIVAAAALVAGPAFAQGGGGRGSRNTKEKIAAWRGDAQVQGKITDESGKGVDQAFSDQLVELLPRLRRFARGLTGSRE